MAQSPLIQVLLVGAGGFIGSAARYAVSAWAQRNPAFAAFPLGTLMVNLVGCLALGILLGLAANRDWLTPGLRLFLAVGVLGGFTTFSAFAMETVNLMQHQQLAKAAVSVALQVFFGCLLAWFGYSLFAR